MKFTCLRSATFLITLACGLGSAPLLAAADPAPATSVTTPKAGGPLAPATLMLGDGTAGETSDLGRVLAAIPGPRIRLFASADRLAILERRIGTPGSNDSVAYHVVCSLPCTATLPVADRELYRIGGYLSQATPWFSLPATDAQVQATLVRATWTLWPTASLVGGVLFGVLGGSLMAVHATMDTAEWTQTTSIGLLSVGGAFMLTSAVLWLVQPSSRVSLTPAPSGA